MCAVAAAPRAAGVRVWQLTSRRLGPRGGNRCRRGLVLTILLAWTAVLAPASANRFSCPSLRA
jgi:hypothetical protein